MDRTFQQPTAVYISECQVYDEFTWPLKWSVTCACIVGFITVYYNVSFDRWCRANLETHGAPKNTEHGEGSWSQGNVVQGVDQNSVQKASQNGDHHSCKAR